MVAGIWDVGLWDSDTWGAVHKPPGAGWGEDWRVWYQTTDTDQLDLTGLVVEARWTTDEHRLGDGTFRGDVQPGKVTLRLWDRNRTLEGLDPLGTIWAAYKPTGAVWCWFYESISRALVAPGDPSEADTVITGAEWPARLLAGNFDLQLPAQAAAARLEALANHMAAPPAGSLNLPPIRTAVAAQSQTVAATAIDSQSQLYPSYLAAIREAGADGVVYWRANRATIGGELTLCYDRWDTARARDLEPAQVIAGPAVTRGVGFVISDGTFAAVVGSSGKTSTYHATTYSAYGASSLGTMRLLGDVENISGSAPYTGPEHDAATATMTEIFRDHHDPTEAYLSTITVQSGARSGPAGGTASSEWDPAAHVWSPAEVMNYDPAGAGYRYRVTKSDHTLNARSWVTTHTLEKFTAPTPLPA